MTGDFPWNNPKQDQQPARITPLDGGNPTQSELENAVEDLFQEIYFGHWRATNEPGFNKNSN